MHALGSGPGNNGLYDPLTGLPGRALLFDRLDHAAHVADREALQMAFMIIGVDTCDSDGTPLDSECVKSLLTQLAPRFAKALRASDSAGRIDGDEFAVVLTHTEEEGIDVVSQRLFDRLRDPVELPGGTRWSGTVAIGVSLRREMQPVESLDMEARDAMLTSREHGGGITSYAPSRREGGGLAA